MPDVPMETPSETAIVLNSIGVAPASRMPRFTSTARSRWLRLHGIVSIQVVATPMMRLRQVVVGEARALEHRARAGAVGAVGERGAVPLRGVGRAGVGIVLIGCALLSERRTGRRTAASGKRSSSSRRAVRRRTPGAAQTTTRRAGAGKRRRRARRAGSCSRTAASSGAPFGAVRLVQAVGERLGEQLGASRTRAPRRGAQRVRR